MTKKRYRRIWRALCVLLALLVFVFAAAAAALIASALADRSARTLPSYAREDISPLLSKAEWTDEDYKTLYLQTGLGRSALDALKRNGVAYDLLRFQDGLFFGGEVRHEYAEGTATTLHDLLYEKGTDTARRAAIAPLEEGDVLISSSSHTFGWRNGHAALVVDTDTKSVLESVAYGMKSQITKRGVEWFTDSANFIVLRLKDAAAEERAAIATDARNDLVGVPYSLTVGILSPKDQCKNGKRAGKTNCAHLVWQAFKNHGYDVDANGGICIVRDFVRSELFEVVQVYGFDPIKLW